MKLEVTYDFVCPWCYLGLTQLSRAIATAQSTAPELTLWPFQLMPELPATGVDNAQFVVNLMGKERAAQMLTKMEALGRETGITIDYAKIVTLPNSYLAHQLVRTLTHGADGVAFSLELMAAHFSGAANLGDRAQLSKIAMRRGFGVEEIEACWSSPKADDDMRLSRERAKRLGIRGVPNFIIDGKQTAGSLSEQQWISLFAASPTGEHTASVG
jgi:predicted DsbA family dithiol-disulfide isomerase